MPTLTPTFDTGGTSKLNEIVRVDPRRAVDGDALAPGLVSTGLNHGFIADLLSAMLTHERCGVHLYRSVAGRTNNPMLKRKYEEFGAETLEHVTIFENLITQSGGNPNYVSPAARAVQGSDTKLLESTFMLAGSVDVMTQEMVLLDAVLQAEAMCHANWQVLAQLADQIPAGEVRDNFLAAVSSVEAQEQEHEGWARSTKAQLVILQAKSESMAKMGTKVEQLMETVKGWLS
jgi:rubrerythrin